MGLTKHLELPWTTLDHHGHVQKTKTIQYCNIEPSLITMTIMDYHRLQLDHHGQIENDMTLHCNISLILVTMDYHGPPWIIMDKSKSKTIQYWHCNISRAFFSHHGLPWTNNPQTMKITY